MEARLTRRELLGRSATLLGAAALSGAAAAEERYVTCFYQFGKTALEALAGGASGQPGLPNGERYLHIFSHSHPGIRAHPDTARLVHACGASFKYAPAFDLHKYKGWATADDAQLRAWAEEFRAKALDAGGAADYWAFNEMPTTGAATPRLRAQAAKIVRYLHEAGGGPKLRGVFYFTERNLNPQHWVGEADDFWAALDETCDLVVGEHYHSDGFAFGRNTAQLRDHFFALPRWLKESGRGPQAAVAGRKYAVLHSSYYGPDITGWAGVQSTKSDPAALERYFRHLLAATRASELGQRRVAFGPLATRALDPAMLPILARVLAEDARQA